MRRCWNLFSCATVSAPPRLSWQAGCAQACPFCATGQLGIQRQLSTAEIVEQVRVAAAMMEKGDSARRPRTTSPTWCFAGDG